MQDYTVVCDQTNNSKSDIDHGSLNVEFSIPLPGLNFRGCNDATKAQLYALIMLSAMEQTNAEQHTDQESWDRAFTAKVKNRTKDQKELAV